MPKGELIGMIPVLSGRLVLADSQTIEETWCNNNRASSGWAIDYSDPKGAKQPLAEALAQKHLLLHPTKLVDGTWRLVTQDVTAAKTIEAQDRNIAVQNGWTVKVFAHPMGSSQSKALDAVRGSGVGMIRADKMSWIAMATEGHAWVDVYADTDVTGKVTALHIQFPQEQKIG